MTKICILAGNLTEAKTWARGQNLEDNQWFYPVNTTDLAFRSDFHVITIGTAGLNTPSMYFEQIYSLAQKRGKIGRS